MSRTNVYPPQTVVDDLALTAQRYVGYFTKHPTHVLQWPKNIIGSCTMELGPWKEPVILFDHCLFCKDMTDPSVLRRVTGYQAAIDKEVMGRKWGHFDRWCTTNGHPNNPVDAFGPKRWALWRQFISETQDVAREYTVGDPYDRIVVSREKGWNTKSFPLVDLPFRLKRKLCIEWNHCLRDWLADVEAVQYDFEKRLFYIDKEASNA